jgi:hypothetical protein
MNTRSAISDLLKELSEERLQEIFDFARGVTIKSRFSSYVDPEVVKRILESNLVIV